MCEKDERGMCHFSIRGWEREERGWGMVQAVGNTAIRMRATRIQNTEVGSRESERENCWQPQEGLSLFRFTFKNLDLAMLPFYSTSSALFSEERREKWITYKIEVGIEKKRGRCFSFDYRGLSSREKERERERDEEEHPRSVTRHTHTYTRTHP